MQSRGWRAPRTTYTYLPRIHPRQHASHSHHRSIAWSKAQTAAAQPPSAMTPTRHSPAVALLLGVLVLVAGRLGAEAVGDKSDCSVAQTAFSECNGYVAGLDDEVPPQCCRGLGDVKDLAPGADQRRDLCACILSEMLAAGKVDSGRAAGLPSACGLSVGFLPTSPDFDCSQIP